MISENMYILSNAVLRRFHSPIQISLPFKVFSLFLSPQLHSRKKPTTKATGSLSWANQEEEDNSYKYNRLVSVLQCSGGTEIYIVSLEKLCVL